MNAPTIAQWVTPISCAVFAVAFMILGSVRAETRTARMVPPPPNGAAGSCSG